MQFRLLFALGAMQFLSEQTTAKAPNKQVQRQVSSDPCSAFTRTVTSTTEGAAADSHTTDISEQSGAATSTVFHTSVTTTTDTSSFDGTITDTITQTESLTTVINEDASDQSTIYTGTTTSTSTIPARTVTTYVSQNPAMVKRAAETSTDSVTHAMRQDTTDNGSICYVKTRTVARIGDATCTPTTLTEYITAHMTRPSATPTPGAAAIVVVTSVTTQTSTKHYQPTSTTVDVSTTIFTTVSSTKTNTDPITTVSTETATETPPVVTATANEFALQARFTVGGDCASDRYLDTHGKQLAADFSPTVVTHFALSGNFIMPKSGAAADMVFYIQNTNSAYPIGTEYEGTSTEAGYTNLNCAFQDSSRSIACNAAGKPLTFWACDGGLLWGNPTSAGPPTNGETCGQIDFAVESVDGAPPDCDNALIPTHSDCNDAFALQIYSRNASADAFVTPDRNGYITNEPDYIVHGGLTSDKTASSNYYLCGGVLKPVVPPGRSLVPWVFNTVDRQRLEFHPPGDASFWGQSFVCSKTTPGTSGTMSCVVGGVDFLWYTCGNEPNLKAGPPGVGSEDCFAYDLRVVEPTPA